MCVLWDSFSQRFYERYIPFDFPWSPLRNAHNFFFPNTCDFRPAISLFSSAFFISTLAPQMWFLPCYFTLDFLCIFMHTNCPSVGESLSSFFGKTLRFCMLVLTLRVEESHAIIYHISRRFCMQVLTLRMEESHANFYHLSPCFWFVRILTHSDCYYNDETCARKFNG
jgi:hypothetical protein